MQLCCKSKEICIYIYERMYILIYKKSGCAALLRVLRIRLAYLLLTELVSELCLDELAVEASDVSD